MKKLLIKIYPVEKRIVIMNENDKGYNITMYRYRIAELFLAVFIVKMYLAEYWLKLIKRFERKKLVERFINL